VSWKLSQGIRGEMEVRMEVVWYGETLKYAGTTC
jgi:hypothetical protein